MHRFLMIVSLIAVPFALSACAPVLVGAAGAVIVDEVLEEERGGDGLF